MRWRVTCKQHFRSKNFAPRNWWPCTAAASGVQQQERVTPGAHHIVTLPPSSAEECLVVSTGAMSGASLNSFATLSSVVLPLLTIITHGMPYAMEVCAANFYAGLIGLNAATRSEKPFAVSGKLRLPACCCYMRLFSCHKHAESHITVSFPPGKREDVFFFFAGSQLDARRSEVGDQEADWRSSRWHCCRGASVVVTMHLRGRFLGARGRPGRPWPTEVTTKQRNSDQGAWGGISGPP